MGYQPNSQYQQFASKIPISENDLLEYYKAGCKKPEEVKIGMEVEKHGIRRNNLQPVTYLDPNGFQNIQKKLIEELNWVAEREEGAYITSMSRGESRLTLEYCEDVCELSGRTHTSIHDLARELRIHQHELSEMSQIFDVVWFGMGYQPFKSDPVKHRRTPLNRFNILEDFFRRKSKLWTETWHKLCSIQANIDYTSEEDARRKCHILLRLAPFIGAMYAHSPLKDGVNTGFVSYRTHILRKLDRRRFGIRKIFFSKNFGFKEWIDFCKKVPMVTIFRDEKWIPIKNTTFAGFMKNGYGGFRPTLDDWILHVSFIYTDIRIKQYMELRVCDSLPPFLIPSLQAVVKAFVYHPDGERLITQLTKDWSFMDFCMIGEDIAKNGMFAALRGKKLLDYCKQILEIATSNLQSFKILNEKNEDESIYLKPIKEFVFVHEKSPGRWVMEKWEGEWRKNPEKLIEWCSFEG
ncbi:hypothetical protein HYW83_05475 [Candidatus Peregrinibacteria bacterium]|nr:hypothetical protein [Candidatus Peregrinibacteria bacterium]